MLVQGLLCKVCMYVYRVLKGWKSPIRAYDDI